MVINLYCLKFIFIYNFKLTSMKLFSNLEYIDNDTFISEGLLDSISDFFGKGVDAITGIKAFGRGISDLPGKTKLIYKLTMSSIKDIVDEDEKQAVKNLLEKYKSVSSLDEIATLNYKYLSRKEFPNSKFTSNLILLTKELCIKSKNRQVKGYLNELFNLGKKSSIEDIERKIEQDIKDNKPEVKKEIKKEETKEDTAPKAEDITPKEVVKVVKSDPIKELCEKANIDKNNLYNEIFQRVAEKKEFRENADDVIVGLSAIVCGALILKNNLEIKPILDSVGLTASDEFLKKIEKVAN